MKYKVRVQDRTFEVDIEDLNASPVVATVEGTRFEVWPGEKVDEEAPVPSVSRPPPPSPPPGQPAPRMTRRTSGPDAGQAGSGPQVTYAPIPGVIDSIAVQEDETVSPGQELCVLEAMKMKNIIRASRAGQIASILVSPGQHVKHNDPLFEYAEQDPP